MTAAPAAVAGVRARLAAARAASRMLAATSNAQRQDALRHMADGLGRAQASILAANVLDLAEAVRLPDALVQRLRLSHARLSGMATMVREVALQEDPVGRVTLERALDDGLTLSRVTCPLGVVGVIFESRPDALVQIAALGIRSGNAVVLKGGREARHSNQALFDVVQEAIVAAGLPADALVLLEDRDDVAVMLAATDDVDLVIPRGSGELVRWVQEHTRIPVLGHAEGVCHVYVDRAADLAKALRIVIDAKTDYPAACNALETLLVHASVADAFLAVAEPALRGAGVELRRDGFGTEYGGLIMNVRVVASLDEAIAHINEHGSRHTDAIVTEDADARERFLAEVDAAGVYCNVSTRFADGFRYGFGAEVGISTGTLHPRGPVGLDGLVTYKYRLVGDGHIVKGWTGPSGRGHAA